MKSKTVTTQKGNPELIEALNAIEKEKDISKDILLEAIENSLVAACKNQFGTFAATARRSAGEERRTAITADFGKRKGADGGRCRIFGYTGE